VNQPTLSRRVGEKDRHAKILKNALAMFTESAMFTKT
jgi:hypothetical protein